MENAKPKDRAGFGPALQERLILEPKGEAETDVASAAAVKDADELLEDWSAYMPEGAPFRDVKEFQKAQERAASDPVQVASNLLENFSK